MNNLYSPQCPTVCVLKKEGGHAQKVHNQPHLIGEMKQLDGDGISPLKFALLGDYNIVISAM